MGPRGPFSNVPTTVAVISGILRAESCLWY
jgi:hypothetical protein